MTPTNVTATAQAVTPLTSTTRPGKTDVRPPKALPAPNSDFYQLVGRLDRRGKGDRQEGAHLHGDQGPADHQQVLVRRCVSVRAAAVIQGAAASAASAIEGYGCAGGSQKLFGFVAMELARVDASFCTFFGVHSGLAMGSIYLDGSEEQKQKWLPPMARWEKIGCFGLTEPLVGSGTSGGMTTTAKREGDTWILNGQKRWIGNAPWCDISIIWARDVADNQVKGFIVENKTTPGFSVEKIEHKIALKVVQNGQITLKDVRVPEANRLQGGNSFRDTARVLRMTRYMVGWASTGIQMGAFEATLKYAQERLQFGKPIASFQMVQDLLAKMLANVTACQCLMVRLAQMDDEGKLGDHHAALAKAFCTAKSRETVAWGRELLGGNGIVADYNVARFFADAEALYSYEGTYQMQNLIVGKAITGLGAFV